jgi:hypothetical protein
MTRKFVLTLAAIVGLSACATYDAASDTRGWFFHTDGAEAKLAYGTPQSDDAPLMLMCTGRSGQVTLSQSAVRPGDGVTLASSGRRSTFYGETEADQLNGGLIVSAVAPVDAPVLSAFRRSGDLAIEENGRRARLLATPVERAQIQQFFQTCSA